MAFALHAIFPCGIVMKCPYGLHGTRLYDRSPWLLKHDCNEMPLWRLHCTHLPYGIVINCPYGSLHCTQYFLVELLKCRYGLHGTRASSHDRSPWKLNKDCNEMPLWLFALHTLFPLWNCNKLPLWRFALYSIFLCGTVMKCPCGLHCTRASSHDRSPWLLELDCTEMPLWPLYTIIPLVGL